MVMPTKIATLGRERNIVTLARRLYKIEGRGRTDLQRRAEAALIAVNPRLSSAEGFRAGRHIVVPTVSGLSHTEEVSTADGKGPMGETTLRLQALGSLIEDSFSRASKTRQKALKHLDDSKFVTEARGALPESTKLLSRTKDRLTREEEQFEARSKVFRKAVSAALEGVKALDEMARRTGPH
jgi:hypothetical protein